MGKLTQQERSLILAGMAGGAGALSLFCTVSLLYAITVDHELPQSLMWIFLAVVNGWASVELNDRSKAAGKDASRG
jgi:hypothetical protein